MSYIKSVLYLTFLMINLHQLNKSPIFAPPKQKVCCRS